jgi:hypothetical protein
MHGLREPFRELKLQLVQAFEPGHLANGLFESLNICHAFDPLDQ